MSLILTFDKALLRFVFFLLDFYLEFAVAPRLSIHHFTYVEVVSYPAVTYYETTSTRALL
jgi:hypothetical protein